MLIILSKKGPIWEHSSNASNAIILNQPAMIPTKTVTRKPIAEVQAYEIV